MIRPCKYCGRPTIFGDDLCGRCWEEWHNKADADFRRGVIGYAILVGFVLAVISAIVWFLVERYG